MIPPRPTQPASARRSAAAALLAGLGAVCGASADAAEDRIPLVAPRPAAPVLIYSPRPSVVQPAALGQFFEPPRDDSAKPGVEDAPEYVRSPAGRTRPAAPGPRTAPDRSAEPDLLLDDRPSVRRIELAPPVVRSGVAPADGSGRSSISDGTGRVAFRAATVRSAAEDADADEWDGPEVPDDVLALEGVDEPAPAPLDPLAAACDEAIRITSARLLTGESRATRSNSPWQIGHGLMALREDYTLIADGRRVRALDWLASGPRFKGEPWFVRGRFGPKAHEYSGTMYDFEGHPNQILAFLAMSDLPTDFVLRDGDGRPFTIAEWITTAKREVRLNQAEEVTWTLWAFSVYLDSDTQWVNARREPWSMERLVQEELKSDPTKHACGGTHGLYALASARNARMQEGHRLRGRWLLAHEKVGRYAALARGLQNPDGSFSDRYFQGRSHQRDLVKRIGTSGHTLEFLMMALPQSELDSAWVRAGVGRVASDLIAGKTAEVGGRAVGGMYHAVHALKLYRERTDPGFTPVRLQTAEGPQGATRYR